VKILIVGFGKMGKSHFSSFMNSNKKCEFFLVDKKFKKKTFSKAKNSKINKLNSLPKFQKFDLVIIATYSTSRLNVLANLIKYNNFKYLILEKFLFSKLEDFRKAEKIVKDHRIKVFVNVWGKSILNQFMDILKNKKIKKIEIYCRSGELLTNLIHYYDFIYALIKKNFFLSFKKNYKIIKSKRKNFLEINGELISKKHNIWITTLKNIRFHKFKIITEKKNYIIKVNYNGKCNYYVDNKLIYNGFFPFSFLTTAKYFYKDFKSKKITYFNNFKPISQLSKNILLSLKRLNIKNKAIT
tara:strand:- start:24738 stop:25631 length:894 start_codon:yes stop_codon:yes gene_type:complete